MGRHSEATGLLPQQCKENALADQQLVFPLNCAPRRMGAYLELIRAEKPTGTALLFFPCAWGLTMAASDVKMPLTEYVTSLAVWLLAAFLIRGAACTINDIVDRNYDICVERCKHRPIASGRITVLSACIFLVAQYVLGTVYFFLVFRSSAFRLVLLQFLPLFQIYPLLKRVTYWPQVWLGLAMNFGLIVAHVAVTGGTKLPLLVLTICGCSCWTVMYDTIYACQDIRDDAKIGIHSTAILFQSWVRPFLAVCGFLFLSALALTGYMGHHGPAYFTSIGGTAIHITWQLWSLDIHSPACCGRTFRRNAQVGCLVWLGLFFDYLLAIYPAQHTRND